MRPFLFACPAYVVCLFAATHLRSPAAAWARAVPSADKVFHVTAFACLGLLVSVSLGLATRRPRGRGPRFSATEAIVLAALAAYGLFDEATQVAVGRTFDRWDLVADVLGAAVGVALSRAVLDPIRRRTGGRPGTVAPGHVADSECNAT